MSGQSHSITEARSSLAKNAASFSGVAKAFVDIVYPRQEAWAYNGCSVGVKAKHLDFLKS